MLNTMLPAAKVLKPFQLEGSKFLQTHPHALLADEPGLGKTIQAIDAARTLQSQRNVVICPASVRENWRQELRDYPAVGRWWVASYEEVVNGKFDEKFALDTLILDESHFLKTPQSQRTQAVFGNKAGVARRTRNIWSLSGTPVLNRPRELWPLLKCLHPDFAKMSSAWYDQRYCGAYFDGRGINNKGASRLEELKGKLEGFMLRRTKAEVLPQLPPKIISSISLSVEAFGKEMLRLKEMEDEIANRESKISAAQEDFSQLGDLAKLLHCTGMAKVAGVVALVEDLLETQDKLVIFTRHKLVLAEICARLRCRTVKYEGGMSDTEKTCAINAFKTEKNCRVFVANISAGGTGINGLQEVASAVVFAELSWVPGEMSQAIDRLHRIGQTAAAVNVYLTHLPGTIESAVLGVQNAKGSVIGRLMGEQSRWRV